MNCQNNINNNKSDIPFNLIIQSNSPGEITAWLTPMVYNFKKLMPNSTVTVFLTPCQYSTGQESKIAKSIFGVDRVYTPKETIKKLLSIPIRIKTEGQGAIIYLGGDPIYSQLLSLKYRLPAFAYTEHNKKLGLLFKKTFFKTKDGDLMADYVKMFDLKKEAILKKNDLEYKDYCLFFAGSRPQHFINLVPLLNEAVEYIKKTYPDFQALLQISSFISEDLIAQAGKAGFLSNFQISAGKSVEAIAISKLLVTIPGTNNAEAMYQQKPLLSLLPLNKPEVLIFDGILGVVGKLPILGKLLKSISIHILKRKNRFYALPNIIKNREIVPELIGNLSSIEIAEKIISIYYNETKLLEIQNKLKACEQDKNLAEEICRYIIDFES
jgi:hypothetical protein